MNGKRLFTPADRALWMAEVERNIDKFEAAVAREIPEFDRAEFEDSQDIGELDAFDLDAMLTAGGILKAQLRRYALTIIPSNMCGCNTCIQRRNILMREYNETAQALRAIQLVISNNGIVGMAADRDKHFEAEPPPIWALN
jgi:hypothetical protein